jgi:hypothetical protein
LPRAGLPLSSAWVQPTPLSLPVGVVLLPIGTHPARQSVAQALWAVKYLPSFCPLSALCYNATSMQRVAGSASHLLPNQLRLKEQRLI